MKIISEVSLCTGCTACSAICPNRAIMMTSDKNGFVYPKINADLCTDCNLCTKVCPVNNFTFNNSDMPKSYAVMANDEIRKVSSSGGAFSVFAEYILQNGGYVCGAVFNDSFEVEHIIIDNINDLYKLRGSKYVQSKINDNFVKIKELLKSGVSVLFVGCPCQVAGLHNYLGQNYSNLITIDLICHGVPSPKVLDKYLREEFNNEQIIDVNFRDKKDGWGSGYITTTTTIKGQYSKKDVEDTYLSSFFANISLRESCYNCNYTKLPRVGDFTIADCWGAKKHIDDKKGTSTVFLNNDKAISFFAKIENNFKMKQVLTFQSQIKAQPQLKYPVSKHPAREEFFNDLDIMSLRDCYNKNICSNKNIGILNFHWENVNFGAVLTSFALNKFLNNAGFNAQNINYVPNFPWIAGEKPNKYFDSFRKKYLPLTKKYLNEVDLTDLNLYFSTFIVGSDQVWRTAFIKNDMNTFFLNFANSEKKLISFAASFGVENIRDEVADFGSLYKKYLSAFDAISVRENNAVEYCKSIGVEAVSVLDPVFLLEPKEWAYLIQQDKREKKSHDIVFYTIDDSFGNEIVEFVSNNKAILGMDTFKNITYDISIEEWLYQIKNSRLFIADSFHGMCFAIIFNKQFICVNKNIKTSTRMKNLLDLLQIKDRLFNSFDDVNINSIIENQIDYSIVNEVLNKERMFTSEWLLKQLGNTNIDVIKKAKLKEDILRCEYKLARINFIKCWFLRNKYLLRLKLFNPNNLRVRLKYENNRNLCKKYKNVIKQYKRIKRKTYEN